MRLIVGAGVVVLMALNPASIARAATTCIVAGTHPGGAHGLVALPPGERVPTGGKPCATTFWVDPAGGPLHTLTVVGPGWHGTVHSSATRVGGLVGLPELRGAVGDLPGVVVWVATRRPRVRVVDALLVGLAVSLVANDTPQDVLFWGAISSVALRRAVYAQRPMRRFAPLLAAPILVVLAAFLLAGCSTSKPGESVTQPLPSTVVGTLPAATTTAAVVPAEYKGGDPVAGKQVFETAGCKGCHTLKDAGATGTVGPNLDQAKPPLSLAVMRVTQGAGAMPSFKGQLTTKQIADVTAYVVKTTGGNLNG
jgi:mono/diheme cytochrome c family protein